MEHVGTGHRAVRGAAAAVVAAVLATALTGAVSAPVDAAAESTTFVWSGESELATGDARTSSPGNWSGGVAPAAGQQVDLVFPAVTCVLNDSCGRVLNDVPGLVATSIHVTTPGRPPGPSQSIFGYTFEGEGLRLNGPLRSDRDTTLGSTLKPVAWKIPLELEGPGAWFSRSYFDVDAPVTGQSLRVKTQLAGGLNIHDAIETDRFVERGRGTSEVTGGSVNAESGGPVLYDGRALSVTDAKFGPLKLRGTDLLLMSGKRPTRVLGAASLDDRTQVFVLDASADHALLKATGKVELGGAKLNGAVDCAGAERGKPFPVIRGKEVHGLLSDLKGRPLPDGKVIRYLAPENCYSEPVAVRIGYTPRAVTLTIISTP